MLGIAVGNVGMPYNDFCGLTPEEFGHIYRAYSEERETQYRDCWERTRTLATIAIQPYAKGKLTPQKILPLPWDNKKPEAREKPHLSKEAALKRFEKVLHNAKA